MTFFFLFGPFENTVWLAGLSPPGGGHLLPWPLSMSSLVTHISLTCYFFFFSWTLVTRLLCIFHFYTLLLQPEIITSLSFSSPLLILLILSLLSTSWCLHLLALWTIGWIFRLGLPWLACPFRQQWPLNHTKYTTSSLLAPLIGHPMRTMETSHLMQLAIWVKWNHWSVGCIWHVGYGLQPIEAHLQW